MIKLLQGIINFSGLFLILQSFIILYNEIGFGKILLFLTILLAGITLLTTRYESFDK